MKRFFAYLIVQLFFICAYSQVTGIVVDENDIALPGANIVIQESNMGTITDVKGKFSIEATPNDSLVFKFLGYEPQKIAVSSETQVVNIKLIPSTFLIEEFVVMGYSNKTKTEISSAVSVLSEDKLNDTPTNDVAGLLQGKVPGVQVITNSGAPGSESEIRIRGISTIKPGNAEPLYVVDGIIGGTFDVNDVATLTVLKDAGATGMYGARANKGVIIVTTKSGSSDKTSFEFKSSYGFNIADHGNIEMMNGEEFYGLSSELYRDSETHIIDKIRFYEDYPQTLKSFDHDWLNEAFKSAPVQKYYLSASGRSNKLGYYLSGSYYNEDGTFINTGYEHLNLRANTNYKFNDRVTMKNNINLSVNTGESYDYMSMYYTYLGVPWDNPFNEDGSARFIDGTNVKKLADGTGWWSRDPINPFHSGNNSEYSYNGVAANYDLILDVKITNWLSFSTSNRLSFSTAKNHNYISPVVAGSYYDKGYIAEDQTNWYDGLSTNLFKFSKDFGNHDIDGLVGVEIQKSYYESLGLSGTNLPEGFDVPSVASAEYMVSGINSTEMFRSFISQLSYNYLNTYFLTGSYRIDATSNFPSNNRTAHFPSISASVLLNKIPFLYASSNVDMLKLRTSYGITGDPEIGASRYMGLFSLSSQYNGNSAATPFQLANSKLTWERTNQFNIGIDLELIKRISFSLDLYNNVTNDLIILAAQPLSQGFESRYENSGLVTNKGLEVALSLVIIERGDFSFTTDFTFAKNSNELSGINAPITSTIGGITQIYENGAELYTFYMPKWLGVDMETGGPLWEKIEQDVDGTIISREATSNYSEAASQKVGSALPDFTGGISASISYKNISFYISGACQYGNKVYNNTRVFMDSDGHEPYYNNMKPKDDWSRWQKPGDVATHPSMQNNSLSKETSSRFLEDGSFFKIRTMSLKYQLPESWANRIKMKEMSLAVTGNNLFTWTEFWGQDPEVTLNNESWSMPGVSDFKYPNSRQFILSLNVKF